MTDKGNESHVRPGWPRSQEGDTWQIHYSHANRCSAFSRRWRGEHRLHRALGPWSLTAMGIGCIIGAGLFVMTGIVAHDKTGPSLILSFVVAGMACMFAALSYAEFASMVPVAGSAYTYSYATIGELFAWIIGWDLILEYTVAAASVSSGWSHYFQSFLDSLGLHLPVHCLAAAHRCQPGDRALCVDRLSARFARLSRHRGAHRAAGHRHSRERAIQQRGGGGEAAGGGAGDRARCVAIFIRPNWHPFAPYGWTGISFFGKTLFGQHAADGSPLGMLAGAAMVFFAYIGFDSVSTQAEEANNPQRDVPIGIIASLVICTVLYIVVAVILTGMVPYTMIDIHAPVAVAFKTVGLPWAEFVIAIGAIAGMTSVLMVFMLSQPRIMLAMARDGLLPARFFGAVHPTFRTPWKSTILTGAVVALLGAVIPLRVLTELVNIGTLLAFVMVCVAVLIMRRTETAGTPALPHAVGAAHPGARHHLLPGDDVFAALGQLAAPAGLARDRPARLLQLWPAP